MFPVIVTTSYCSQQR